METEEPLRLREDVASPELRGREDDELVFSRRLRAFPWMVLPTTLAVVAVEVGIWMLLGGGTLTGVLGGGLVGGLVCGLVLETSRWFTRRVEVRVRKDEWSWRYGGEEDWREGEGRLWWSHGWLVLGGESLGWVGLEGHVADMVIAVDAVRAGKARPLIARRALVGFNRELDDSPAVDHVEVHIQPRFGDHAFLPWIRSMMPVFALLGLGMWIPLAYTALSRGGGLTTALVTAPTAAGTMAFLLLYVAEMVVSLGWDRPDPTRIRITGTHFEVDDERWPLTELRLSYQHHDDASVLRVRTSDEAPWHTALRAKIWELRPLITSLEEAVAHAQEWTAPLEAEQRDAVKRLMGGVRDGQEPGW